MDQNEREQVFAAVTQNTDAFTCESHRGMLILIKDRPTIF